MLWIFKHHQVGCSCVTQSSLESRWVQGLSQGNWKRQEIQTQMPFFPTSHCPRRVLLSLSSCFPMNYFPGHWKYWRAPQQETLDSPSSLGVGWVLSPDKTAITFCDQMGRAATWRSHSISLLVMPERTGLPGSSTQYPKPGYTSIRTEAFFA